MINHKYDPFILRNVNCSAYLPKQTDTTASDIPIKESASDANLHPKV